jgi:hypothetical protein
MHRRPLILTLAIWSLTATFAQAESSADQITRQLRDQGFSQITVAQTWLGRTRIVGQSKTGQREIILNPRTGEILRDLFTQADGKSSNTPVIRNTSTDDGGDDNGGNGSSGGGDGGSGSGGDNGGDGGSGSGGDNGGDGGNSGGDGSSDGGDSGGDGGSDGGHGGGGDDGSDDSGEDSGDDGNDN